MATGEVLCLSLGFGQKAVAEEFPLTVIMNPHLLHGGYEFTGRSVQATVPCRVPAGGVHIDSEHSPELCFSLVNLDLDCYKENYSPSPAFERMSMYCFRGTHFYFLIKVKLVFVNVGMKLNCVYHFVNSLFCRGLYLLIVVVVCPSD